MRYPFIVKFLAGALSTLAVLILLYQAPPVRNRLAWRVDFALTYLRGVVYPAVPMPTARPYPTLTPLPPTPTATAQPPLPETLTATPPPPTPTPTLTPTPLPGAVRLEPPRFEQQGINNCGPATLAMLLRYYGWEGNQYDIANLVKPVPEDRNVNVEELAGFVRNEATWLRLEYRVGMSVDDIRAFLAAGFPMMIEETFRTDQPYWPNDDLWAGHYLLVTGYDDATRTFIAQDSYYGPNRTFTYDELNKNWQSFNRVLLIAYLPEQEEQVKALLGANWDLDANRQQALEKAEAEAAAGPKDGFAWFNKGTNLVYFERYGEAAEAYDAARSAGLPQRMLRYQFGPFLAYFHSGRTEDLIDLAKYALQRTPNSEEAMLWYGWGLFREGDRAGAEAEFRKALAANPTYQDAKYALDYLRQN